jgi:DNA-binding HxlR family transcriptional regulator
VDRHGQYCPVSYAADALGDRWTLLIMREVVAGGARRFNEIERCLPRVSRTLLSQRLRRLAADGLLEIVPSPSGRGHEYHPTPAAKELEPVLLAMGEWAVRWVIGEPRPEEVDPTFLMVWMSRRVDFDELPPGRTVVRFDLLTPGRSVYWLVLEPGESSVCMTDPGLPVDVNVIADGLQFERVHAGRITLADAVRDGSVEIVGPSRLTRQLPRWFWWSPFAEVTRRHVTSARR